MIYDRVSKKFTFKNHFFYNHENDFLAEKETFNIQKLENDEQFINKQKHHIV